jgi:cell division protein FtsZ
VNFNNRMGAGSKPEKGKEAAEESLSEVLESLQDCNMLFLAAGNFEEV